MTETADAHFIQHFLLPFWQVESRPLIVGDLLGHEAAQSFANTGFARADQETLYEQIFYKTNACVRTDVPWPHRDALMLSVAAHDLIALADPKLSGRRRRKFLPLLEETLRALPTLERYDQLAVRWAVLEQLERCVRRDTTVRFWVGRRIFRGRRVPKRLVALPRLRRVRTSSKNVSLREVWPEELEAALSMFWGASPLSWLCQAQRWNGESARPRDTLLHVVLRDPPMRAFVAEAQRSQELGWLRPLLASSAEPLKRALRSLALDLRATGAEHPALSSLLDTIALQDITLFDQRIAKPLLCPASQTATSATAKQ